MQKFIAVSMMTLGLLSAAPAFAFENNEGAPPPPRSGDQATGDQRGGMQHQRRGSHGDRLREMDKDGDGAVSKAEFLAKAEERFARMDTNHDGKLTPEDRPKRPNGGGNGDQQGRDGPPPPQNGAPQDGLRGDGPPERGGE